MATVIKKCGRFALIEGPEGFRWELTTRAGALWHWEPLTGQWTPDGRWSRSPEEASAGLESTPAYEAARGERPEGRSHDLCGRVGPSPSGVAADGRA
jgi:hypothetical protein